MIRSLVQLMVIAALVLGAVLMLTAPADSSQAGRPAPPTTGPVVGRPGLPTTGPVVRRPTAPTTIPMVASPDRQEAGSSAQTGAVQ